MTNLCSGFCPSQNNVQHTPPDVRLTNGRLTQKLRSGLQRSLPIKCVEAVYIALLLTQTMPDVDRLPLIFYSKIQGHIYGHIVLGVHCNGMWGAMGLSRRPDLM